jgi:hypothetical protein
MRPIRQTDDLEQASEGDALIATSLDRGYLTDGKTLFHVERTFVDSRHGELLVELEDCYTLDLIVCSARVVAELGVRPVWPLAGTPA